MHRLSLRRLLSAPMTGVLCVLAATLSPATPAMAQTDKVLNLYTARHYQTDEALYAGFTRKTGIKINRIEAGEDALLERLRNEGRNSPADVFVTVDAGRLWRAEQLDLFQPLDSAVLNARIPAQLRTPAGTWFGFSTRARVIAYNRKTVRPEEVATYEDLAHPRLKGRICIRASNHVYNLSLMGAMIERLGEAKAEEWARGVVANLARPPRGGDTDQILGVAAGECDVAVANTYYYVRLMKSTRPQDRQVVEKVALSFPNQATSGTHMNVSGAGMLRTAPNPGAARLFLEYLASDEAQVYFADGNNEWPAVASAVTKNPELASLGKFRMETTNIGVLGRNQPLAQKILDRVGWK
jgi:iron(III) transport system substrate-binding protein